MKIRLQFLLLTCLGTSPRLHAGSHIGFETAGAALSTDSLVIADQWRPANGVRFSRADAGSVVIAKAGLPCTAFAAGQDTAVWTAGDSVLSTDARAASVGDSFVKLNGNAAAALVIDYDYATAAASGLLIDIDADETWAIRGYSDAGVTLVAETVLTGGAPGTGDQTLTPWALTSDAANIVQIRIVQTGSHTNAGAALDRFNPYGLEDFASSSLALTPVSGPSPAMTFQLASTPGHRVLVEYSDSLVSGSWTMDQAVRPGAPFLSVTSANADQPERRFWRAAGAAPLVDRATAIYTAVSAFVNTLSTAQQSAVIFAATDTVQRSRWSNFPTGIFQRAGLKIGDMTLQQKDALWAMLATVMSPEGYQKIARIVSGDDQLGTGGTLTFGTNEYHVSFVGTPSPAGKYLLQFGGHHLATNITIKGAEATIAPALPGAQPASYTYNGRTVRPIGDEYDLSFALLNSLTATQRTAAVLSSSTRDLALGPGQDGVTLLPEGLKASDMTVSQRAILLDLIGESVNIIHDDASRAKMDSIRANIADATDATYFSWRGPTTSGSAAYYRIQGPNLFIEWAPQAMGGSAVNHIHAMYRELGNDYGALISN